ncbi:MAG: hypothetical protein JWL86_7014 [Rhizobium sp.]|nr:hypothetical protein [Rhizobium sp.]
MRAPALPKIPKEYQTAWRNYKGIDPGVAFADPQLNMGEVDFFLGWLRRIHESLYVIILCLLFVINFLGNC